MNATKRLVPLFRRALALLAGLALAAGFAGTASATAIYAADATATLRVVGISGGDPASLIITGLDIPPCSCGDAYFEGNAIAVHSGSADIVGTDPANLAVGEGADLAAHASGSASPDGYGDSYHSPEASIDVHNLSATETFTIDFRLDWSLFADASAGNPLAEYAYALADVYAESLADILLDELVDSDTEFGPFGPQALSGTLLFSLTVAPGESDYVDIFADAAGVADSVPAPSTQGLLAIGFLALALASRRRATTRAAGSAP